MEQAMEVEAAGCRVPRPNLLGREWKYPYLSLIHVIRPEFFSGLEARITRE